MTKCEQCKFWEAPTDRTKVEGVCHRHAPAHISTKGQGLWPRTHPHGWCGEGEPKDEEASPSQD